MGFRVYNLPESRRGEIMKYTGICCREDLVIEKIYSIHYFEYMSSFYFSGEAHDFWEFICVDKGEVIIGAGEKTLRLKKGDLVFHEPGEFHWVKADGEIAPNLIVVSFSSDSEMMDFFRKRRFVIDNKERQILADVIHQANICLKGRLDDPYQKTLVFQDGLPAGASQLLSLYLQQFLILLHQRNQQSEDRAHGNAITYEKISKKNYDRELFERVTDYMEGNLSGRLTLRQICRDNLISKDKLQRIIRQETALGVIEYFLDLKIEAAKEYIRSERMNFSQIAEVLGYSSVHYFSRQFKQITRMTPSEYACSIKAMAEESI